MAFSVAEPISGSGLVAVLHGESKEWGISYLEKFQEKEKQS